MAVSVSVIGFGEAAMAFAADWRRNGLEVRAYDILTEDALTAPAKRRDYERLGVRGCESPEECLCEAPLVMSLVTADQALSAARAASPFLARGSLFFDCNSVAPATKVAASEAVDKFGGCYLDTAIMAPVEGAGTNVPLLLSGEAAEEAAGRLRTLGFDPTIAGRSVGDASTIKMLRSVIIKGVEALTAECLAAAERAGVVDQVLAALGADWPKRAAYNLERMAVHGSRRAAEMREVAATLEGLGVCPTLTRAAADWQERLGAMALDPADGLEAMLGRIAADGQRDAA